MADLKSLFPALHIKRPDVNLTLPAEQFEVLYEALVKMPIELKRELYWKHRDHFKELVAALEQQHSRLKTPSRCR
jgi:hypothetical protein